MTEGQVPPRVQWEGLLDRGAYYLSPQHFDKRPWAQLLRSLVITLLCEVAPSGCRVASAVLWEGLLSTISYYTINISIVCRVVCHTVCRVVCQTTAVNPLMSVFTVWPYYSRVNIEDPDGCNTKL